MSLGKDRSSNSHLPSARKGGDRRSGEMAQSAKVLEPTVDQAIVVEEDWLNQDSGAKSGRILLPLILGLILITVTGGYIYHLSSAGQIAPDDQFLQAIESEDAVGLDKQLSVSTYLESRSQREIEESVRQCLISFLSARDARSKAQFTIEGESAAPWIENYNRRFEQKELGEFEHLEKLTAVALEGLPFYIALVRFTNGEEKKFSLLPGSTSMLIHWGSSFGFGDLSWNEFLEKKPTDPVMMRIWLRPAKRVINERPETHWSYLKDSEDFPEAIFVDPSRADFKNHLQAFETTGGEKVPFTVELAWSSEHDMPEIRRIRHRYWIDFSAYYETSDQ